jgi:2-polyprenyl-3-methyl-5-hydroxy-6-metoxy-1,4-benzoquinol methylase
MTMKEEEIRPQDLFNRFLAAAREDIETFFSDHSQFVATNCAACGSQNRKWAFDKLGFQFQTCRDCGSLYLSPRPSPEAFDSYFHDGKSVKFWSTDFYRETAEARREKIFRPRAELIARVMQSEPPDRRNVFVDVGSGYGIFLEEVARQNTFKTVMGIERAPNMAEVCRKKGFKVIEKSVEDVSSSEVQADMVTTFEVLEHVFEPADFLRSLWNITAEGGIVLFTTLTISGFDLQVLWDRSKSIYPPHHINLISVEGMHHLVESCGFEVIEIATPGSLDVDIVANAMKEDPTLEVPRFVKYLVQNRDEQVQQNFQTFLQQNQLSSHIRCIARKPSNKPSNTSRVV